jgi:hypothetical protein
VEVPSPPISAQKGVVTCGDYLSVVDDVLRGKSYWHKQIRWEQSDRLKHGTIVALPLIAS